MEDTYFIRVKNDYAASIIEGLAKSKDIELVTADNFDIPEWQIDKVREAVQCSEKNPGSLMDWASVKDSIKRK